jgi:hypothetical protein
MPFISTFAFEFYALVVSGYAQNNLPGYNPIVLHPVQSPGRLFDAFFLYNADLVILSNDGKANFHNYLNQKT